MIPLIPLLLGLAPTVASWVMGDKTGAAVAKVSSIAQEILGTSEAGGIEAAIGRDPALALQFKMAVMQAEADDRRLAHEEIVEQLHDVQSARNQTIQLAAAGSPIAWASTAVSVMAVAVFGGLVYLLFTGTVAVEQRDALMILVGTAGSGYTAVLGYWLGSSIGSQRKDATISKLTN